MKKETWRKIKLNPEPTYLQIDKARINLETGNIEFLEGYNPDETAKQFWGFIAQYKPKFIAQQEKEILEEVEQRIRKEFDWVDEYLDDLKDVKIGKVYNSVGNLIKELKK